ncbi:MULTISPECIES: hypothetical protein [Streptomyces]|uniref:Uncharacterized protein n=1 Tax=Streptomyces dengpaensis TaxID=2049881 RepID=A0ABM6SYU3_9ACTN|nr:MULTISPECIES: hypothetical protein [Streptomyces]AVH59991.1 hypothetical protein C4B68_34135 [Streptomyces dengpaensis]PIB09629.1 hypothetical protein B1C81_10810 [Streptomyces sp. HG99]
MTALPTPSLAEEFPIRQVRFVNGRTYHRTRRPDDERWWDLLEAACGKQGYLARGYPNGAIRECPGCVRAVEADTA